MSGLKDAIDRLVAMAAPASDEADLRQALAAFRQALFDDPAGIGESDALQVLKKLKSGRHPLELVQAAEAILQDGRKSSAIEKLLVQGLVDSGFPSTAAVVATDALARSANDDPERAELTGLLGRCAKDQAVGTSPHRAELRSRRLDEAAAHYEAAARLPAGDNGRWPRINALAVRAFRAREHGGSGNAPSTDQARELLEEVARIPPERRASWDMATACEAAVALQDWDQAELWLRRYVEKSHDAFELNSTLRQLTTLWGLGSGGEQGGGGGGRALVAALGAAVLSAKDGTIRLDPGYPLPLPRRADAHTFEAVFGHERGLAKLTWILTALERTKSVARISYGGRGFGTGFLLAADSLPPAFHQRFPEIAGRRILVTNAHVLSQPRYKSPQLTGLEPADAIVTFEGASILQKYGGEHRIEKLLWSSPPAAFDCTLALMDPEPVGIEPLPVSLQTPLPPNDRVYVIGHPLGGEISLSLQDNELLDRDDPVFRLDDGKSLCRLRYRAPTQPGSSGSPVFDAVNWQVVALHHAGGTQLPKLNGGSGFEAANEGIALASIIEALA